MPINGLTEQMSLPRLGKIRLGKKVPNKNGNGEHPVETEYFVVPDKVAEVYGPEPKELDVMFPVDDPNMVFPHWYKWFGGSGLKCWGDGETATRRYELVDDKDSVEKPDNPHDSVEIACPCFRMNNPDKKDTNNKCGPNGNLMVILPKVNRFGVYQIDIRSVVSIRNINSMMVILRGQLGRISGVPLTLKRVPTEMTHEGRKTTHYITQLECHITEKQVELIQLHPGAPLAALETPEDQADLPGQESDAVDLDTPADAVEEPFVQTPVGVKAIVKARAFMAELKSMLGKEKTGTVISQILVNATPFELEPPYRKFDDPRMQEADLNTICQRIQETIESERSRGPVETTSEQPGLAGMVDGQPD